MAEPYPVAEISRSARETAGVHSASGREWMAGVPSEIRGRIRSGMRWTVWLTALAVPFSYGGKILLARTGPATIGAYGLLSVYIGVVTCVLYFGGDSVAIKFLPELERDKRASFLFSYFLVICVSMVPWLAFAMVYPGILHYLFGRDVGKDFLLPVLCLAPLPILFSVIQAVLKAKLDFRRAQLLSRMVTVGSFLGYAFFFFFDRRWLLEHSVTAIWAVYLGLASIGIALGLHWLRRGSFIRDPLKKVHVKFWLPRGFWTYALGTQSISFVGLLHSVDFILVLNFGGMKTLGGYVAITTLAFTVPVISRFFYETLLPSLTNLLAAGNKNGAREVFHMHMRLLLLVIAVGTCGLIFLATPLLTIFGPAYRGFTLDLLLLGVLMGLASPGATGGTLLSAIGKPHRAMWASVFQAGLNAGLFFALWPRFHLLGAVAALGISQVLGRVVVFLIAAWSAPFRTGILRDYARLWFVLVVAGAAAWLWEPQRWLSGLLGFSLSVLFFLLVGRYRWADCRELWQWVVPGAGAIRRAGFWVSAGLGRV